MKKTSEAYSLLYDYYGALLTSRQREVFELYHEENLSLSEIAETFCVSRQAVHIALNKASSSLDTFEEKLGLLEKHSAFEKVLREIDAKTDAILKDKTRAAALDAGVLKDLKRFRKLVRELDI